MQPIAADVTQTTQVTERLFLGLLTPSEVLALLTLVLVIVTGFYAWQTRRTVEEMKRARSAAILPRLAVSIIARGAGVGWPRITNVGPGPAIDVDARMSYVPGGPEVTWRAHVLAPTESHEFFAPNPDKSGEVIYHIGELIKHFSHIKLVATYRDALGDSHSIDEAVEIRDWWHVIEKAHVRLHHDPAEETVKELEKLRKPLESLARDVEAIRQRREHDPWVWEHRVRGLPKRVQEPVRRLLRLVRVVR